MLQNRLTWDNLEKACLFLLLSFPLVDYVLRHWIKFGGGLWDKATLVFLLGAALLHKFGDKRPASGLQQQFTAYLVLGLIFLVMNMPTFLISLEGFRANYQYMLAFFIGYYLLVSIKDWIWALRVLMGVGLLIALYGLLQPFLGVQMPAGWVDAAESARFRAFSIVQSPNVLGSYMALLIPIGIGLFFAEKKRNYKLIWLLVTLVMGVCLLATLSRGAWLAFAAAILFLAIIIDRRVLILTLIAGILVTAFVPQVTTRFTHLFSATYMEKSAEDGRISRWGGAFDQARNEPFFGRGLGHYGGAVAQRNLGVIYVDNYYAKTIAEVGLVGLSLFLWLIFSILRKGYQRLKEQQLNSRIRWLMRGVLTGLVAVLLHNGVENIFEVPFMSTYFWLLAGLLLSVPYLQGREEVGHE